MRHSKAKILKTETRFNLVIASPFDLRLTVTKHAGWHWSIPGEVWENESFWSGIYFNDVPIGLRMSATGNSVNIVAFSESKLSDSDITELKLIITAGLGANEDLAAFYQFALDDPILSATIKDLYGMRIGLLDDVFGRVILAILLRWPLLPAVSK